MIRKFLITLACLYGSWLTASELWLEPQKFILQRGESLRLNFREGEGYLGENWMGKRQDVEKLTLYYNGIKDDLEDLIPEEEAGDSLILQFFDEGTGMICYLSDSQYVRKDDRTDSLVPLKAQHCVKTIFQVGKHHDATYKVQANMPMELVPLNHPYEIKKGQALKIRVLMNQLPLTGHKVEVWHKLSGKVTRAEYTSDLQGDIHFIPSLKGRYLAYATGSMPADSLNSAPVKQYTSSLSWGY